MGMVLLASRALAQEARIFEASDICLRAAFFGEFWRHLSFFLFILAQLLS